MLNTFLLLLKTIFISGLCCSCFVLFHNNTQHMPQRLGLPQQSIRNHWNLRTDMNFTAALVTKMGTAQYSLDWTGKKATKKSSTQKKLLFRQEGQTGALRAPGLKMGRKGGQEHSKKAEQVWGWGWGIQRNYREQPGKLGEQEVEPVYNRTLISHWSPGPTYAVVSNALLRNRQSWKLDTVVEDLEKGNNALCTTETACSSPEGSCYLTSTVIAARVVPESRNRVTPECCQLWPPNNIKQSEHKTNNKHS